MVKFDQPISHIAFHKLLVPPGFDQGRIVPAIRPPLSLCVRCMLKERTRHETVLRCRRVLSIATYRRLRGLKASTLDGDCFHYANSLDEIAPRMAFALQGFGKRR